MRHKPKVSPISPLKEERHSCDEPKHSRLILTIQHPDDNQEHPRHNPVRVQHHLLRPHAAPRPPVRHVRREAAQRPRHAVQKAEHGGPVARLLEAELGEVLHVVVSEDAVDGELGAERAEVARGGDERVLAEHDAQDGGEGGLLDDFPAGGVYLCEVERGAFLGFGVGVGGCGWLPVVGFLGGGGGEGVFLWEGRVGDGAVDGDGGDGVAAEGVLCGEGAVGPAAGGGVVAEEEEAEGDEDDEDAWDDEGDAPGFVGGNVLLAD